MYGLYRAWFGGGATSSSYPCLQDTFSPPDTVVRVGNEGEHQFVAHKGVLAAHSGYLKALLTSAATTTATTTSNSPFDPTCATVAVTATNGQSQRPVTSVSVSSIGKYRPQVRDHSNDTLIISDRIVNRRLYNTALSQYLFIKSKKFARRNLFNINR